MQVILSVRLFNSICLNHSSLYSSFPEYMPRLQSFGDHIFFKMFLVFYKDPLSVFADNLFLPVYLIVPNVIQQNNIVFISLFKYIF